MENKKLDLKTMENKKGKNIQNIKELLIKRMLKQRYILRNSKYGQFIIQTNEVQSHLILLILLRTALPNEKLHKYLERMTLGSLINCFRICIKNSDELTLVNFLKSYNKGRITLAHRMYTKKRLTETNCELSIKSGEKLLTKLKKLIKI